MNFLVLCLAIYCAAFEWPWEDLGPDSRSAIGSTSLDESASIYASATATKTKGRASYAPIQTECPSGLLVREATSINDKERSYLMQRHEQTNKNLITFLSDVAMLSELDAKDFIEGNKDQHNISIALAFSGGGYRAMLCGAGEILALDDRYEDLTRKALGGLLQSSSYISGLSGGSWMIGTLVLNDWMTVGKAVLPDSGIWQLDSLIFNPNGINVIKTLKYYSSLRSAVSSKTNEGFDTSITDVWGRALSYQFFDPNSTYNWGENITWSSIAKLPSFQRHQMPFPILLANGRTPGTFIISDNATIFEITPYELGSWDPSLNSFVNLTYLGTTLENGKPGNNTCFTNYDNAGFILGTLSSLFNMILIRVTSSSTLNWAVKQLLALILRPFSRDNVDIATYNPNPFYGVEFAGSDLIISDATLDLVDGGEDAQNIPIYPFIQTSRKVDIIFAFDNSADTNQWPNGTSLVHTFERQFTSQGRGSPFPYVPLAEAFIHDHLNDQPLFLGCDAANLTALVDYHDTGINETDIPLVIYVPNLQYLYEANTSTYKMSYSDKEVAGLIKNGFEVSSRGNYTGDRQWPTCVGCAIVRRQQERLGMKQSDECAKCFATYCWRTHQTESTTPSSLSSLNEASLTLTSITSENSNSSAHLSSSLTAKSNGVKGPKFNPRLLFAILLNI